MYHTVLDLVNVACGGELGRMSSGYLGRLYVQFKIQINHQPLLFVL
jgi:hypothetical protein